MFALIFAGILLVGLVAITIGISTIIRFLYGKIGVFPVLVLVAALAAWPVIAWKRYAYRHALNLVPSVLDVTSMRFKATEFMGFGPGGSEAGLLLFDLPDVAARRIAHDGINYLSSMDHLGEASTGHRDYWGWQKTPAVHPGFPVDSTLCVYEAVLTSPQMSKSRSMQSLLARTATLPLVEMQLS